MLCGESGGRVTMTCDSVSLIGGRGTMTCDSVCLIRSSSLSLQTSLTFVCFCCNDEQEEPKEESDDDMGFSLFD